MTRYASSCHLCPWYMDALDSRGLLESRYLHMLEAHPEAIEAGDPFATRAWEPAASRAFAAWAAQTTGDRPQ